MTLLLILPKIYLLKCHLQENKTDTLSSSFTLTTSTRKSVNSVYQTPPLAWSLAGYDLHLRLKQLLIAPPGKNRSFYYYPEHSGE